MKVKQYYLGCDIGGTFTDFCLINGKTGEVNVVKCPTTPDDPARAVFEGIRRFLEIDKECLEKCI